MKLCYIGRVPTNWWPRRVLCALWTRRPIVKLAMGCRTEPAAIHIAHVLQRLHFFQFFNFFFIIHTTYCKKNYTHLPQKKNYTHLPQKKLHDQTIFLYSTYIFHGDLGVTVHYTGHPTTSRWYHDGSKRHSRAGGRHGQR